MKDKAFKKVMMRSKMATSEGFTEDLMKKLATRKAERPTLIILALNPMIWSLVAAAIALLIIFYLLPLPNFNIMEYTLPIEKTPLMVIVMFLLLFGINNMLRLKGQVSAINRQMTAH